MNNNCGTHEGLQEALEERFKATLQEWFDNPTPANMTAFTNACEPFDKFDVVRLREELGDSLIGSRSTLASLVEGQDLGAESRLVGPGHDPSGNEW